MIEMKLGDTVNAAVTARPKLPGLTGEDLEDAMEYAGMKMLNSYNYKGSEISETSAAFAGTGKGLCSNPEDIESCEDEEVEIPCKYILAVSFTNTALTFAFTVLTYAHSGYEYIYRPYVYMGLNAMERYSNQTKYWEAVGQRIRNFNTYPERIDTVLVMGEAASNEDFQKTLRDALRDYRPPVESDMPDPDVPKLDVPTPDILGALNASAKFDPLSLAARGAAEFAKRFQVMTWNCMEPGKCYKDEDVAQMPIAEL
jgi:hypothetical protein